MTRRVLLTSPCVFSSTAPSPLQLGLRVIHSKRGTGYVSRVSRTVDADADPDGESIELINVVFNSAEVKPAA